MHINNANLYHHPSRRSVVYGSRGMAATSTPAAAMAGLDILKRGGNAVDAAVAMAMALTVVEPTSNGIGGDAFCIIWHKGKLLGLNSSGCAPALICPDEIRKNHDEMPETGFIPVTVPGAPGAWAALAEKFGRLPLSKLAEPAIEYAENGYPVSPEAAQGWQAAASSYKRRLGDGLFSKWAETFLQDGEAPKAGQTVRLPFHAKTLKDIADSGSESFYRGEIADKIDKYFKENNAPLRKSDLAGFSPEWVKPLGVKYRGYDVWELPPNGQGLVALMALAILDEMPLSHYGDPLTSHKMIEAVKLAFTDGQRYITDPRHMPFSPEYLLSKELTENRRNIISGTAIDPVKIPFIDHGTVYLCAADADGTMVSYIQSNYMGFGSGVVIPETGIAMQNRGANFSLDPNHPNCLAPGKRPYHTIIPGFLTKDGKPIGPFGVMGGFMQPQGHVQVLANMLDFGMNPQSALDAPRWQWTSGRRVSLEVGSPPELAAALRQMGHVTDYAPSPVVFGRGHMILLNEHGNLTGAAEPRCDGCVAAW